MLDAGRWILEEIRNVFFLYPVTSIWHPVSVSLRQLDTSLSTLPLRHSLINT
jgi:hypothetical protein